MQASSPKAEAINASFSPVSAFADYVAVPAEGPELTLTFTSYPAECLKFTPPPTDESVMLSVVVTVPPSGKLATTTYLWAGHEAHGGTPSAPEQPYVEPLLRRGRTSYTFAPGGGLRLSELSLDRNGRVRGVLAFEARGEAERAATTVSGSFEAQICRLPPLVER